MAFMLLVLFVSLSSLFPSFLFTLSSSLCLLCRLLSILILSYLFSFVISLLSILPYLLFSLSHFLFSLLSFLHLTSFPALSCLSFPLLFPLSPLLHHSCIHFIPFMYFSSLPSVFYYFYTPYFAPVILSLVLSTNFSLYFFIYCLCYITFFSFIASAFLYLVLLIPLLPSFPCIFRHSSCPSLLSFILLYYILLLLLLVLLVFSFLPIYLNFLLSLLRLLYLFMTLPVSFLFYFSLFFYILYSFCTFSCDIFYFLFSYFCSSFPVSLLYSLALLTYIYSPFSQYPFRFFFYSLIPRCRVSFLYLSCLLLISFVYFARICTAHAFPFSHYLLLTLLFPLRYLSRFFILPNATCCIFLPYFFAYLFVSSLIIIYLFLFSFLSCKFLFFLARFSLLISLVSFAGFIVLLLSFFLSSLLLSCLLHDWLLVSFRFPFHYPFLSLSLVFLPSLSFASFCTFRLFRSSPVMSYTSRFSFLLIFSILLLPHMSCFFLLSFFFISR